MSDDFVAEDFEFGGDPLITVIGFGFRAGAMGCEEFATHFDVGAWGAQIQCGAWISSVAAQELGFDRAGKVLIDRHGFGSLTVEHHAAISDGPTGSARSLLAYESVFDPETVLGVDTFVEEVSEAFVEFLVSVVPDLNHAVLDAKGIGVVITEFESSDFWSPTREVFSVE